MVDFTSGSLFQPIQFDFTSGIKFLQEQQKINIERERLELQKQQEKFDQGVERSTRGLKNRAIAAEAFRNEQIAEKHQSERKQEESLNGFQDSLNSTLEGLRDFIQGARAPQAATLDGVVPEDKYSKLGDAFGSVSKLTPGLVNGAARSSGASRLIRGREQQVFAGVSAVLGGAFVDEIQADLHGENPLDAAAIGAGQRQSSLFPLYTTAMISKAKSRIDEARSNTNQMVQNIGRQSTAASEKSSVNPGGAVAFLEQLESQLINELLKLDHPAFGYNQDETTSVVMNINDQIKAIQTTKASISDGAHTLADPAGAAVTQSERDGVAILAKSAMAEFLGRGTPDEMASVLGNIAVAAKVWIPEMSEVFRTAFESNDPNSQLKASMILDEIKGRIGGDSEVKMWASIASSGSGGKVGMKERLLRMSAARRTYFKPGKGAFATESGILRELQEARAQGDPERLRIAEIAYQEYAQEVVDGVDQSFANSLQLPDGALSEKQQEEVDLRSSESDTDEETRIRRSRVVAFGELGRDGFHKPFGNTDAFNPADVYDITDISQVPNQALDDYNFELTTKANLENTTLRAQRPAASAEWRARWTPPWFEGDDSGQLVNDHPVQIARETWGDQMPSGLSVDVFMHQLQPLIDLIPGEGGEPPDIRRGDLKVERRIGFDPSGRVFNAYNVIHKATGNVVIEGFVPDYSADTLRTIEREEMTSMGSGLTRKVDATLSADLRRFLKSRNRSDLDREEKIAVLRGKRVVIDGKESKFAPAPEQFHKPDPLFPNLKTGGN